MRLETLGLPSADWGPLYSIWYYALSFIRPDALDLFVLNVYVLTLVLPMGLYVALRRQRVSYLASLLVAVYFLICRANLTLWPKVSHLALLLVLLGFALVRSTDRRPRTWILASTALAASYVRPELFVSFLLLAALALTEAIRGLRSQPQRHGLALVAAAAGLVVVLAFFGSPMFAGGSRDLVAFGQHYSLNWMGWTGAKASGFDDWRSVVQQNFGPVASVSEAFRSNPASFGRHLLTNAYRAPGLLVAMFAYHVNLLLPARFIPLEAYALISLGAIAAIAFAPRWLPRLRRRLATMDPATSLAVAVMAPELISVAVIYPRPHYLLILGTVAAVWLTVLARNDAKKRAPLGTLRALLAGLIVVAATPAVTAMVGDASMPNLETIRFIKELGIDRDVNLLDAEGGCHVYLGDNFHRVDPDQKEGEFSGYLIERRIDMIVLTGRYGASQRYSQDETWRGFLEHFGQHGFVALPIPKTNRHLLIDGKLLDEARRGQGQATQRSPWRSGTR